MSEGLSYLLHKTGNNERRYVFLIWIALIVAGTLVLVDQLLKIIAVNYIKPAGEIIAIDKLLSFVYVENRGAAFGMLQDKRWIFITVTILLMAAFIWYMLRYDIKSKILYWAMVLIIAGGIGNLIDRIFLGYVVDFISLSFFPPVFNFADCCVTVGAVLLIITVFSKEPLAEKKRAE